MASAPKDERRNPSSGKRVAVVGAGVSGLAAAYKLKSHGLKVTVFEAEGRAGGKLRSVSRDGLIWDEGANTMTESEVEVKNLIDDLGLRERQQFPISQNKRYIVRNGKPVLIPTNPIALITSNILSAKSKFQIILEPFLWRKPGSSEVYNAYTEERWLINTSMPSGFLTFKLYGFFTCLYFIIFGILSILSYFWLSYSVGEFFQRHFGKEVVEYLIDPFVAGTSAGDPESLSARHSFPELWNLEKRFGSIIAGAFMGKLSTKREKSIETKASAGKKRQPGSFSFLGGMQTLANTLCRNLTEDELRLGSKVLSLSYNHDYKSVLENWSVSYSSKGTKNVKDSTYDAIIMTAPLCNVKEMKITKSRSLFPLDFLPEVSYMPLSVIITTFKKENIKRPLEGFGVLVPSKEQQNGLKTLGTLFSSMMFPDRAPDDLYLYTTFIGGSRNKELAKASTDSLKQIVTSDLRQLLGAEGEPTFVNHFYWSKAFPLYGRNYDSVLKAIDEMEKNLPGFFYAGNHKGGLSVGKAIASGCKAADLVISYLESSSGDKIL
ncbi:protoporphyrinogen oxidase, mitochondrial isoform X2 [Jatropha curcas]|uniref:protoporphyrinogen oxidase, mitochondrial isoform X2 n=1 Tax=Jatropha curcas TaxID=180498 RepID=UPI0005FACEF9|nr:protoporphyrinogen oxidase, mitochondrial isoform X2 [Jatropha curcas]